jgi:hypothetical protein
MTFKIVAICYRCGNRRAVVDCQEQDERRGYCRKCAAFLRGEISEAEAPPLRHALAFPRPGRWT